MTCVLLFWLLTHVLMAWLGGRVAERYRCPWLAGALVGLVFHVPGVLVLWLVLDLDTGPPPPKGA